MTQYVSFNSAQPDPKPITGSYDTAFATWPNMPPAVDLLALTPTQWAAYIANPNGWVISGGAIVAATVPAPTLAQQALALLAAGLVVTSTSMPSLSATYPTDPAMQDHIQAEVNAILLTGTFADGTASVAWPDVTGTCHTFPSVAEFKLFAIAIAAFVAGNYKVLNGSSTVLPAATASIG
jgi:hypothetical protein